MSQVTKQAGATCNKKSNSNLKSKASIPVRICSESKNKIDTILDRMNKERIGRKVKADDLISVSIDLLTDAHLEQISTKLLSNKERLEILFRQISKTKRGMNREEFLGLLLDGKLNLTASVSDAGSGEIQTGRQCEMLNINQR